MSTYGGALSFIKGSPPDLLDSMPDLRILLINTKVPRSTKEYVAGVRRKLDAHQAPMGHVLEAMDSISKDACKVYAELKVAQDSNNDTARTTSFVQMEGLINLNQHLLNAIGVGHPALDAICAITQKHSLATKLTGAGGKCSANQTQPGLPATLAPW